MPPRNSPEEFEKIVDSICDGNTPTETVEISGKSLNAVLKVSDYIKLHGTSERDVLKKRGDVYTSEDGSTSAALIASLVEFVIMTGLAVRIVRLIFKERCCKLDECLAIRKHVGHPLIKGVYPPTEFPKTLNLAYLDELVKQKNNGKSLAEVRAEYEEHLSSVLPTAEFMNVVFPSDFHLYIRPADDFDIDKFIELYKAGLDNSTIALEMGIKRGRSKKYETFCNYHGTEELKKSKGVVEQRLYNLNERLCIVETLDAFNIGYDTGSIIFKCQKGRLSSARKNSKAKQISKEDIYLAKFPETVDMEFLKEAIMSNPVNKGKTYESLLEKYYAKHGRREFVEVKGNPLTDENRKTRTVKPNDEDSEPIAKISSISDKVIVGTSSENRVSTSGHAPQTGGRARAKPHASPYRKDHTFNPITKEQKKDQERIQRNMELRGVDVPILDELKADYPNRYKKGHGKVMRDAHPKLEVVKNPDGSPKVNRYRCVDRAVLIGEIKSNYDNAESLIKPKFKGEAILIVEHEIFVKLESDVVYVPVTDAPSDFKDLFDQGLIKYTAPVVELAEHDGKNDDASAVHSEPSTSSEQHEESQISSVDDDACALENSDCEVRADVTKHSSGALHTWTTKANLSLPLATASSASVQLDDVSSALDLTLDAALSDADALELVSGEPLKIADSSSISKQGNSIYFIGTDTHSCVARVEQNDAPNAQTEGDDGQVEWDVKSLSDAEVERIRKIAEHDTQYYGSPCLKDPVEMETFTQICQNINKAMPFLSMVDAEEYIKNHKGKPGRHPYVIVNSKGFDKLDPKTQARSIDYTLKIMAAVSKASFLKKKFLERASIEYAGDFGQRLVEACREAERIVESEGLTGCRTIVRFIYHVTKGDVYFYEKIRDPNELKRTEMNMLLDFLVCAFQKQRKNSLGAKQLAHLIAQRGIYVSKTTVAKAMKRTNQPFLRLNTTNKYSSNRGANHNLVTDAVLRNFHPHRPRQILFTDIMMVFWGDKLQHKGYLASIVDGYNNEIVAWSFSPTEDMRLVLSSLDELVKGLPEGANVVIHTDQGKHYFSDEWVRVLDKYGISRSMSRKGVCNDNALIECIQGIIKEEFFSRCDLRNMTFYEIGFELGEYIRWFNNERPNEKCRNLSPIMFANQFSPVNLAAAA